jgi:ELWxxDGT repeat protein
MTLSYFAQFGAVDEELWVTDGTLAGTRLVKTMPTSAKITQLTMIGTRVYFTFDGNNGNELWTSDGTAAGTVLLKLVDPGGGPNDTDNLTNFDGTLFFTASDPVHGNELWKTDGTAAGTVLVKDINPGLGDSDVASLTAVNGTLFFEADDGRHGFNGSELWKSDGTTAGTVLVKDINPANGSSIGEFTNLNGTVFFEALDSTNRWGLWKTDGTAEGTVLVKDFNPFALGNLGSLQNVNGTLFFTANDGVHGDLLWRSDGTAAGSEMIMQPGAALVLGALTNVNGTLFFDGTDGVHGDELWKSDGTLAGTVMVKDIAPGAPGSLLMNLTAVGGTLFFSANDGTHGAQLWKSDGTAAGTIMVTDIHGNAGALSPDHLVNVNGVLEFNGRDSNDNIALFRSDGTAAGTVELATNFDFRTSIGFAPPPLVNDFGGDRLSDILWRNASGALADWTMNGGSVTSGGFLTSGGVAITPDASWSVAGIADFNGDSNADVLWRNSNGGLAEWLMNGTTIMQSLAPISGGSLVTPDASWTIAGVGDFDGDSRSDILWRSAGGALVDWSMNGGSVASSGFLSSNGVAIAPDASWSVAGIGDFDGDGRKDVLWRNSSGEVTAWLMNGSTIVSNGDIRSGGVAVMPDASWSIAGVGDFNHDGRADILWRNGNGNVAIWLMDGTTVTAGSGISTSGGAAVTPDASWHVVEIGDFNGDSNADILWRSDTGAMAEWLMNGSTIIESLTPSSGGAAASPDASWNTQARPTNG